MRPYKMFSNTAVAPTEDELYQSATALQPVPRHPTPFNPHIGEFSNAYTFWGALKGVQQ